MPQPYKQFRSDLEPLIGYATSAAGRSKLQLAARNYPTTAESAIPTVFIADQDPAIRTAMRQILEGINYTVECFADASAFLNSYRPVRRGCLLVDARIPAMGAVELLAHLKRKRIELPTIVMSDSPALSMAVHAMKSGAVDFIAKPVVCGILLEAVDSALSQADAFSAHSALRTTAVARMSSLTGRQRQVLDLVLAGHPSKNIASDLQISQRTVDNHRAAITRKTCSKSLPALIQTALWANGTVDPETHG